MTILKILLVIFFLSGLFIMLTGVEFWKNFLLSNGTSGTFLMDPHDPNGGLIEVYGDVGLILAYSSPLLETIILTTKKRY